MGGRVGTRVKMRELTKEDSHPSSPMLATNELVLPFLQGGAEHRAPSIMDPLARVELDDRRPRTCERSDPSKWQWCEQVAVVRAV